MVMMTSSMKMDHNLGIFCLRVHVVAVGDQRTCIYIFKSTRKLKNKHKEKKLNVPFGTK